MKRLLITALLVATTACASQSEVDALKRQIEQMKRERSERQEELKKAVDSAQADVVNCKFRAEMRFNDSWEVNSTPVNGKPGMREGNRDMLNHLREEQHRADVECQRDYENALEKAKLLYGSAS
jgi:polyhydroxyalkanoate synthesis regulator phasin